VVYREDRAEETLIACQTSARPLYRIMLDLNHKLAPLRAELPRGYEIVYGGDATRMVESMAGMGLAGVVAAFLVFAVMAGLFESFKQPFIMMFAVPLQFIGIFLLMFLTGTSLSMTSAIGIMALMGIVVNNSIILVDRANQIRERGLSTLEALRDAGVTRMRPILMTATTTGIALVPVALNTAEGSEVFKGFAIAVLGGLATSTFLSLLVVPIVYAVLVKDRPPKE
jgi:HAE1 family hydrophobic/amphiphilic exporter-1